MKNGIVFVGMGFELLGLVLAALYLGQIVDQYMKWPGYGVALFVVAGLVSWMTHLIYMLKRFMKENADVGTDDDKTN